MTFRNITVHEITMSLPDVIRVELRDPPYTRGDTITMGAPVVGSPGTFFKYAHPNKGGALDWGYVMGLATTPGGNLYTTVKFREIPHACFLDRAACKVAANWGISGGSAPAITAVYYANDSCDHGGWGCPDDFIGTSGTNVVPYILGETLIESVSGRLGRVYSYPIGSAQLSVIADSGLPGYFTVGRTITGQTSGAVANIGSFATSHGFANSVAFRHYFELKLSSALASRGGPYTITFPPTTGIAPVVFNFDDRVTRANSLKFTLIGHRASDEEKIGFFEKRILGAPNEGRIHIINDYGINQFEIINSVGSPVATGLSIVEQGSPTTPDGYTVNNVSQPILRDVYSATNILSIVSVSNANPGVMTVGVGQGALVANDDRLLVGEVSGMNLFFTGSFLKVKNKSGDTFQFQVSGDGVNFGPIVDGTGNVVAGAVGNRTGPHGAKLYKVYQANNTDNHVFRLNYTSVTTPTWLPGFCRARIPGIGVSDPFRIGQDVWYRYAAFAAGGHYNNMNGNFCDGRFNWTRGYALRDGQNSMQMYWSDLPAIWASQGGLAPGSGYPVVAVEFCGFAGGWGTTQDFDGAGGCRDAGDLDSFLGEHTGASDQFIEIYDWAPAAFMNADFGWPTLTELGVAGYTDMDAAPDLLVMAINEMEWLRRTQKVSGGISPSIDGELTQGHSGLWESSDHAVLTWYSLLPDHRNTFFYAKAAAHLARLLGELGYDAHATAFLASAELAWDFSEDIFIKLNPHVMNLGSPNGWFGNNGSGFVEETITGSTSGATAIVVKDNKASDQFTTQILLRNITGTFTPGETITGGTFGKTATVSGAVTINPVYNRLYYYDAATQIRRRTAFTANSTAGSYVLTNVSNTAGINVGDEIVGPNIARTDVLGSTATIQRTAVVQTINTPGVNGTITLRSCQYKVLLDGTVASNDNDCKPSTTATGVAYTAIRFNGGWTESQYDCGLYQPAAVQPEARRARVAAAMAINRAICDPDLPGTYTPVHNKDYYRTRFEADPTGGGNGLGDETGAQIDYCLTADPAVNTTTRDFFFGGIENGQTNFGAVVYSERTFQQWKRCISGYSNNSASQYGNGGTQGAIINEVQDRLGMSDVIDQARRRKAVIGNAHSLNGCNIYGLSNVTGWGPRWYCSILHDDGLVIKTQPNSGSCQGSVAWGTVGTNKGDPTFILVGQGDFLSSFDVGDNFAQRGPGLNRLLEPYMYTWPNEHVLDSRWNINEMEFSPLAIDTQIQMGMWLHGWDGNSQITTDPAQVALQIIMGPGDEPPPGEPGTGTMTYGVKYGTMKSIPRKMPQA
jgi:hypothetical protein